MTDLFPGALCVLQHIRWQSHRLLTIHPFSSCLFIIARSTGEHTHQINVLFESVFYIFWVFFRKHFFGHRNENTQFMAVLLVELLEKRVLFAPSALRFRLGVCDLVCLGRVRNERVHLVLHRFKNVRWSWRWWCLLTFIYIAKSFDKSKSMMQPNLTNWQSAESPDRTIFCSCPAAAACHSTLIRSRRTDDEHIGPNSFRRPASWWYWRNRCAASLFWHWDCLWTRHVCAGSIDWRKRLRLEARCDIWLRQTVPNWKSCCSDRPSVLWWAKCPWMLSWCAKWISEIFDFWICFHVSFTCNEQSWSYCPGSHYTGLKLSMRYWTVLHTMCQLDCLKWNIPARGGWHTDLQQRQGGLKMTTRLVLRNTAQKKDSNTVVAGAGPCHGSAGACWRTTSISPCLSPPAPTTSAKCPSTATPTHCCWAQTRASHGDLQLCRPPGQKDKDSSCSKRP